MRPSTIASLGISVLLVGNIVCCPRACAQTPENRDVSGLDARRRRVEDILSRLQAKSLWVDSSKAEGLRSLLQEVRVLRDESFAPVLAGHIAYSPWAGKEHGAVPLAEMFPVVEALKSVGIASVPPLLKQLVQTDPDDTLGGGRQAHSLIIRCLIDVYDRGGYGTHIARKRLELEMERSSGLGRARLERALQHPFLGNAPSRSRVHSGDIDRKKSAADEPKGSGRRPSASEPKREI